MRIVEGGGEKGRAGAGGEGRRGTLGKPPVEMYGRKAEGGIHAQLLHSAGEAIRVGTKGEAAGKARVSHRREFIPRAHFYPSTPRLPALPAPLWAPPPGPPGHPPAPPPAGLPHAPSWAVGRQPSCLTRSWQRPECRGGGDLTGGGSLVREARSQLAACTPPSPPSAFPSHQHVPPRQCSRQRLRLNGSRPLVAGLGDGRQHRGVKATLVEQLDRARYVEARHSELQLAAEGGNLQEEGAGGRGSR